MSDVAPIPDTPTPVEDAPAPKKVAAPKAAPKAAAPKPPEKTLEQRARERAQREAARDRERGYREETNAMGVTSFVALSDGFSTTVKETMEGYLAAQPQG